MTVRVITELEVARLAQRHRVALERQLADLVPRFLAAEKEYDAIGPAIVELTDLNDKTLECHMAASTGTGASFDACYERADMVAARERLKQLRAELGERGGSEQLDQIRRRLSGLVAEYRKLMEGHDLYADVLAYSEAAAKTDADGKFSIALPANEMSILVAQAGRLAGGEQEHYQWAVRVPYKRPGSRLPLMLANDNMVGVRCAECLDLRVDGPTSDIVDRIRTKLSTTRGR